MINKTGISNINRNSKNKQRSKNGSAGSIVGRVIDIILNENHKDFYTYGGFSSIGTVIFNIVGKNNIGSTYHAKPSFPNFKSFPIIGELILCFQAATPTPGSSSYKKEYYYTNSLNLWTNPHHNVSPNPTINNTPELDNISYSQVEAGLTTSPSDIPQTINFDSSNPTQNIFLERSNIHPLIPFMGDIIHEGRFGQSLRLGSTSPSTGEYQNKWSSVGVDGDPITILRNGQPTNSSNTGYLPISEDINLDLSSIYLTSYQKLNNFNVASKELYNSYEVKPIAPSQYTNPQILLNSDRIVINAKKDSILLSSQKSIGLSTIGSVNIDAKEHYISSNDIKLGSIRATQPVLLGDDTIEVIKQLVGAVKDLASILQVQQDWPNGELKTSFNVIAGNVIEQIDNANGILSQLNNGSLKSRTTKVQ